MAYTEASMTATRQQRLRHGSGPRALVTLVASALMLWAIPARAQTPPGRPSDQDLKTLIDQIDEGRDKFEGNLDGSFKGSTVPGPNGETKVEAALQDYQDSTKKLQSRFNSDYAAGPEASTVLKQATSIERFMKGQPATMNGRPEWDRHAAGLKLLAQAYGTTFPLPEGASASRVNDKEPIADAAAIASAGEEFKDDLDKLKTLPKADKDVAKKEADVVIKQANTVKDRISDGKPATSDVQLLATHVAKLQPLVDAHPEVAPNWQSLRTSLGQLQQAFFLTR